MIQFIYIYIVRCERGICLLRASAVRKIILLCALDNERYLNLVKNEVEVVQNFRYCCLLLFLKYTI